MPTKLWTELSISELVRFSLDCNLVRKQLLEGDVMVLPIIFTQAYIDGFNKFEEEEFNLQFGVASYTEECFDFKIEKDSVHVFVYVDTNNECVDFRSTLKFLGKTKPVLTNIEPVEGVDASIAFDKVILSSVDSAPLLGYEENFKEKLSEYLSNLLFSGEKDAIEQKQNLLVEDEGILAVVNSHLDFLFSASSFSLIDDYIFSHDKSKDAEITVEELSTYSIISRILDFLRGNYLKYNRKLKIGFVG